MFLTLCSRTLIVVAIGIGALSFPANGMAHDHARWPLVVTETHDGFAGPGGMSWRIEADGRWTMSAVHGFKLEPVASGRLSDEERFALVVVLHKYRLESLNVTGESTNNPRLVRIASGNRAISLRGPASQPNPNLVQGRVAGILEIVKLLAE